MKRTVVLCLLAVLVVSSSAFAAGRVRVQGYTRQDGTYVQPHSRTAPDRTPTNNYSYPGNLNPNTGRITGGDAFRGWNRPSEGLGGMSPRPLLGR